MSEFLPSSSSAHICSSLSSCGCGPNRQRAQSRRVLILALLSVHIACTVHDRAIDRILCNEACPLMHCIIIETTKPKFTPLWSASPHRGNRASSIAPIVHAASWAFHNVRCCGVQNSGRSQAQRCCSRCEESCQRWWSRQWRFTVQLNRLSQPKRWCSLYAQRAGSIRQQRATFHGKSTIAI